MNVYVNTKASLGDILYYLTATNIHKVKVVRVKVDATIEAERPHTKVTYFVSPGPGCLNQIFDEKEIGNKYFLNKNDILKRIADQL